MGTKGSHLVLDHPALRDALEGRMAYFEAVDGRVCIVYPFLDRVLVGSTDIPVDDPDQIGTEPAEVDYLLEVLAEVFPNLAFGRGDVVYTYVGVRPLARSDADKPGQISRDHSVVLDLPNATRDIPIVGLVGGKWTTFRALAEEATDQVLQQLGRPRTASTEGLPIGGGAELPADAQATERFIDRMVASSGVDRARAHTLLRRYGSKAMPLAQRLGASGDVALRHAPDYSVAELSYLCLETGVIHLDDLVIRRTLLAIRGLVTDAALAEMASIAAEALGWDAAQQHKELQACTTALARAPRRAAFTGGGRCAAIFRCIIDDPSGPGPAPNVNAATDIPTVLDRSSESPLWAQFRDALRLQILQGVLPIGAKLPSEAELGEQFGISRIVVREALADLVRNNLIYKIKGRGAFVSARERDEDFVSTVLGFSDEMERKGCSVRTQILTQELRAPTAQEAASLGLTDDTQVVALKRLRSVDGELRLLVETVVPADLAPGLHRTRLDDRSLYDVLRRQYGLRLVRAERWIDAVLPDAATCELLNLPTPEPLLRIESIAYGANGRPLEHYRALHRCKTSRLHVQTTT
jgi:DNA-binding GntR family transcriptional regulator